MNTFYSITYLNIRPEINERISLGILMITSGGVSFNYSRKKLTSCKKLISPSSFKAATKYLGYIQKSVNENYRITNDTQSLDLSIHTKYSGVFSKSYIEYLSRYNNNLITFSKPKSLDIEASEEVFIRLFEKLIDTQPDIVIEKPINKIVRFKKDYYPKVRSYFAIDKTIDSTQYKKLLAPIRLDLLGRNKKEVFGQSIDFESTVPLMEHSISKLMHLHYALPEAQQFIIGSEPSKTLKTQHRIWKNIRSNKVFDYVDLSEADRIEEYAIEHNVIPLIIEEAE